MSVTSLSCTSWELKDCEYNKSEISKGKLVDKYRNKRSFILSVERKTAKKSDNISKNTSGINLYLIIYL